MKMTRLALVFLVSLCACRSKTPPTAPSSAPASQAPEVEVPADPGPRLTMKAGAVEARTVRLPPLRADAILAGKGHLVVRAPFTDANRAILSVREPRRGMAVHELGGRIYVRLAGEERPSAIELDGVWQTGNGVERKVERGVVTIELANAKKDPALTSEFFEAASQSFAHARTPFHSFAEARLSLRQGRPDTSPESGLGRAADVMSLYTGMTSVDEALQRRRGLRGPPRASPRTIPLARLKGPAIAQHPWEDMLRELGRDPQVEPLAGFVPHDMLYLHFHDIRTFIGLARDFDDWFAPALHVLEAQAGDVHVSERIEAQLALGRSRLAETLGHLAVKGFAIASSDPQIREGNDISVLFHVANRATLDAQLDAHLERARQEHGPIEVTSYQEGKVRVTRSASRDRKVNRHRVDLGDVVIVSNSPSAIAQFVAVAEDRAPSLGASGEFRYFRALYPFAAEEEDAFLFLSDAFVARAVGPRSVILEARRMQARADLAVVANAALLYGWLEGARPQGFDSLTGAGVLQPGEKRHLDGTPITFSPDEGPRSAWGSLAGMTPLIDLGIERVTAEERDDYQRFAESYQRNWTFVDPIGVRVRRSKDGTRLAVDSRMMPLIEFSDYNELVEMVGEASVSPPRLPGVLQLTLAIGTDAKLRSVVDGMAIGLMGNDTINIAWLGDWVAVGASDRSGLWDAMLAMGAVPQLEPPVDSYMSVLGRVPVYVMAHVRARTGLVATLAGLRAMADSVAPGLVEWGPGGKSGDVDVVSVRVKEESGVPAFAIHYAVARDVFVASLDRATLDRQIGAILGEHGVQPAAGDAARPGAQTWLSLLTSRAGYLQMMIAGMAEGVARDSHQRALLSYEALSRGLPGWPGTGGREAALGFLGVEPASVHGGSYRHVHGIAEHSLYGGMLTPRYPELPVADSPVTRVLAALARLELGLSFEGEGRTRALHTQLIWERVE